MGAIVWKRIKEKRRWLEERRRKRKPTWEGGARIVTKSAVYGTKAGKTAIETDITMSRRITSLIPGKPEPMRRPFSGKEARKGKETAAMKVVTAPRGDHGAKKKERIPICPPVAAEASLVSHE